MDTTKRTRAWAKEMFKVVEGRIQYPLMTREEHSEMSKMLQKGTKQIAGAVASLEQSIRQAGDEFRRMSLAISLPSKVGRRWLIEDGWVERHG